MNACRNAKKYKAKKPPRCDGGKICDECRSKWVMSLIEKVARCIDRAPMRIIDGKVTRKHLNIIKQDLGQVLPPPMKLVAVRKTEWGGVEAEVHLHGVRLVPILNTKSKSYMSLIEGELMEESKP